MCPINSRVELSPTKFMLASCPKPNSSPVPIQRSPILPPSISTWYILVCVYITSIFFIPIYSILYSNILSHIKIKMAVSSTYLNQLPSIKLRSIKKQAWKRKCSTTATSLLINKPENAVIATKDNNGLKECVASILTHLRRASKFDILKPRDNIDIKSWTMNAEIAIDRTITSCRFFAMIAVVGTLAGSVLCFVEGCFLMLESYVKCFLVHAVSHKLNHGMMQTAIEAIDMFLVGTAMLTFGLGLYSMFVGFTRSNRWLLHGYSSFGIYNPKKLSVCPKMNSISHAKTRLGQAVVMLLQVGVIEKFKNVPLVTGIDLACFAGALLFSSASMFIISKLYCDSQQRATIAKDSQNVSSRNYVQDIDSRIQ